MKNPEVLSSPAATPLASARLAVEVRNASVIYQAETDSPVHALSDIDLEIREGEFVALIGPSGCGKTTLMRVIADLEKISAGQVLVNGVTPHEARLARAYGYVFQAPALFPWRTVLANVTLPLQIQGRSKTDSKSIALAHLARVGLTGFEGKYPWQLSGGM
ncbi:MAG: ATP-binding cassette domain-containing protein, partial [Rhodoferax sp.]